MSATTATLIALYMVSVVLYARWSIPRARMGWYDDSEKECKVRQFWVSIVWPIDTIVNALVWIIRLPGRYLS